MSIVEMSKIRLYSLKTNKDEVLNSLLELGLVEQKSVASFDDTYSFFDEKKYSELEDKKNKIDKTLEILQSFLDEKDLKAQKELELLATDFENYLTEKKQVLIDDIVSKVGELLSQKAELVKDKLAVQTKINQLSAFLCVKEKFSDFRSTKYATFMLGTINPSNLRELDVFLKDYPYCVYEKANTEGSIIKVFFHNDEQYNVAKKLSELGFVRVNFEYNDNAIGVIKNFKLEMASIDSNLCVIDDEIKKFVIKIDDLKIASDCISFSMQKLMLDNDVRQTKDTFVFEGYLAKKDERAVSKFLDDKNLDIEYEFLPLDKNEIAPTITKNSKIVSKFEFVTNMYSAPHYGELDPNVFVAFFFSAFFGFIMADIGYGICLLIGGVLLALKNKKNPSASSLWSVIAVGGVFSILFGCLFSSFFGVSHETWNIIPPQVLPNPVNNVITMLVACLGAGVVQIMVAFFLKGVLLVKKKQVLQAIFSAFLWDTFFVGLVLFALEFAGVYVGLGNIGIALAVSSVAVSVIGLFAINKGFDRVSKSFGSLYSIIGLFSDILSYARLFGLMLSGAIIASIVNQLASGFLTSLSTIAIGAIILLIGHSFNLAMGALGAYIHVARLQYIEFFSRFYEGEGELFVPFGSNFSYVKLIK